MEEGYVILVKVQSTLLDHAEKTLATLSNKS